MINSAYNTAKDQALSEQPLTKEERLEKEKQRSQNKCDFTNSTEGDLHLKDGYNCIECLNRGYTEHVFFHKEFRYYYEGQVPCRCTAIREAIRRLEKSGLKNIIRDYTFDKFEATEQWQSVLKSAAMKFVSDCYGKWFFIGGESGSGKTHLCTAICGELLKQKKNVKYMLWRDDIMRIKSNANDAEVYADLINEFKECEVLYIDDLFKNGKGSDNKMQRPTVADVNAAYEILNYRYNNPNLVTIISSERKIAELLEIDSAIGSRIVERAIQNGYGYSLKEEAGKSRNYRLKFIGEL